MPRYTKAKIAIPALVVILVAVAAGAQLWAQRQARANLDSMLASLPPGSTGHYAGISYNVFTRTLRVDDLTIDRGGRPSLSIAEAVVHHLAGTGDAASPFHTDAARLKTVVIRRGAHRVTIALVQARNIDVLAAGLPPPANTPSWLVAPDSGTLIAATSLTADGIADDQGATLAAVSMAGYSGGHLRQASASRFADGRGSSIVAADAEDIDLGGLDRVFDTGRYTPGAPVWAAPRILIGHALVTGFASQSQKGGASVQSIHLDGFAAQPFAAAPGTAYVRSPAFAIDAAKVTAVETFGVTGLAFHDTTTGMRGSLGGLSLSGYADGALAHAALSGLAITGGQSEGGQGGQGARDGHIGHLAVTGLTATRLLDALPDASKGGLAKDIDDGAVRLAGLTLTDAAVTPTAGAPISLASLQETLSGQDPVQTSLQLRGLEIPGSANAGLAAELGRLGLDALALDLDEQSSYAPSSGDLSVGRLALTVRKLGRLSLSGRFIHVPFDMNLTGAAGFAALSGIGIGPFTVGFTNDTLLQRIVAMQARQTGKTPEDVQDQMKLGASFMAAALVPGQEDAGAQMGAFVADPRRLTITAAPAAPVPLGAFLGTGLNAAKAELNLHLAAQ